MSIVWEFQISLSKIPSCVGDWSWWVGTLLPVVMSGGLCLKSLAHFVSLCFLFFFLITMAVRIFYHIILTIFLFWSCKAGDRRSLFAPTSPTCCQVRQLDRQVAILGRGLSLDMLTLGGVWGRSEARILIPISCLGVYSLQKASLGIIKNTTERTINSP